MKKRVLTYLLLLAVFSCRDDEGQPVRDDSPAVTEIGSTTGDAVTKEIGAGGGELSSGDGILSLVVPSGAVSSPTQFSIQPITNHCPGGMFAYRLLPEGLTFTNPVSLTFHYSDEDISGTSPDFLGIAFQGSDKVWYRLPAVVNTPDKTISVQAKHFTDWSVLSSLVILPTQPPIPNVRVKQSLNLELDGAEDLPPLPQGSSSPSADEDDLPPLPQPAPFQAKWSVNGVVNGNSTLGKIVMIDKTHARYEAPEKVPTPNTVSISAELSNFRTYDFVNGRMTSFNNVILFKEIKIVPDDYKYTLEVSLQTEAACGLTGQLFSDKAEMDVLVQNEEVTVSNIVNHPGLVNPTELGIPSTKCKVICTPGPTGLLNITSVPGSVAPSGNGTHKLYLILTNTGATTNNNYISCEGSAPSGTDYTTYEHAYAIEFVLKDSAQVINQGANGYFVKLTPTQ